MVVPHQLQAPLELHLLARQLQLRVEDCLVVPPLHKEQACLEIKQPRLQVKDFIVYFIEKISIQFRCW